MSAHGDHRVAIVTGGSGEIGRACVERLARDGFTVVVGYGGASPSTAADSIVDAVSHAGDTAIAHEVDVADTGSVWSLFSATLSRFGGIDVVIHTAGVLINAPIGEMDLRDYETLMRVNARGSFIIAQQAARRLRDGGSLIMLSSSVHDLALETYGAYSMTKAAIEALTRTLAREVRGRDITVNAVAPGPVRTAFFLRGKDQATIDRLAVQPPLQRLATPQDIAPVVAFLASPDGHWINGQVIRPNGGIA